MDKRQFLKNSAAALSVLPLVGCSLTAQAASTTLATKGRTLPKRLQKGDTVGLIASSAAVADQEDLVIATEVLQALGFNVKAGRFYTERHGHLAGRDADRASDLNAMFADPEVKAIICARGGSGAARILPLLDYEMIRRNPKPLLGYSDITALHNALLAKAGLVSFHGPNGIGSWNAFNVDQFERMFFQQELLTYQNEQESKGELVNRENRTRVITLGKAQGELMGGNLTVLTSLAGTPYLPDFQDKILFLEDIEEQPYRIDRMMSTLKLMGALDKIKGFVFGDCNRCTPGNGWGSLTLDEIFADFIKPLGIPAYRGAMIGHIPKQFILPVGAKVEMDANAGTLRLLEPVFQR
ncbi:LD-carboxypeptidase [Alishewanella sp. SMS8]|uniref:S66 peptidase family protein n=1 Tax=Alishewanella sp. SMS8 TaxID=2994676 RepID=UPI0027420469|nr:LD-carboxypeptidase [Alishewanella sp. SMS8]MDP5459467.1 LD-carboxypeptidase [Alishewanella sp. SMS8]